MVGSDWPAWAPAGRVTSTSSGVPSKLGTRSASVLVGQKRTPLRGWHEWPNGVGGAAAAGAAQSSATTPAVATAAHPRSILLTLVEFPPGAAAKHQQVGHEA